MQDRFIECAGAAGHDWMTRPKKKRLNRTPFDKNLAALRRRRGKTRSEDRLSLKASRILKIQRQLPEAAAAKVTCTVHTCSRTHAHPRPHTEQPPRALRHRHLKIRYLIYSTFLDVLNTTGFKRIRKESRALRSSRLGPFHSTYIALQLWFACQCVLPGTSCHHVASSYRLEFVHMRRESLFLFAPRHAGLLGRDASVGHSEQR